MTCPRCSADFASGFAVCPECGLRFARTVSGVMKTSAVMIAAGREHGFYRSVQDVPEPLRARLLDATTSANAGTIVIADRAGKEQLTQVIGRRESLRDRAAGKTAQGPVGHDTGPRPLNYRFLGYDWVVWAGVVLGLGAVGTIAAVLLIHW